MKLKIRNNIRFYRKLNELKQEEVARALKKSTQTISLLERNEIEVSLEFAMRTARYFKMPLEELFFEEGNEPKRRLVFINDTVAEKFDIA